MKSLISSLMLTGALVPLFWFNVVPWAKNYCPRDSKGKLQIYTVQRENGFGEIVTLMFGDSSQQKLCRSVLDYPA